MEFKYKSIMEIVKIQSYLLLLLLLLTTSLYFFILSFFILLTILLILLFSFLVLVLGSLLLWGYFLKSDSEIFTTEYNFVKGIIDKLNLLC